MKHPVFTGSGVAIITPFTKDGVDYPALKKLLDFQINNGTDAIIVCGTTGEASTMTHAERMQTIETVVEHVNHRVPVIAGSGGNNTETALQLSKDTARLGVDALLVVTPYYNKATPRGLIRHYTAIADAVTTPVILYNVPGRTGVRCTADVYAALAKHPNIYGVKEASGDLALVQRTRRVCPEEFYIWSGDDAETAPIMLFGGKGVISVAANVVPHQMHQLTANCLSGDFRAAAKLQLQLNKLMEALFWEVNPIPVKTALSLMGYCQEIFRLPMCEMEPDNRRRLQTVLKEYSLLS
ncbi:MAG: 4-hydroxy-tetrahydrodipicolinate synthase [Oscillospiraceae bacterium]|nr:4-hydroxy-tetrahydrodipicolinate synthase [Oscillospiraceae bacterium]